MILDETDAPLITNRKCMVSAKLTPRFVQLPLDYVFLTLTCDPEETHDNLYTYECTLYDDKQNKIELPRLPQAGKPTFNLTGLELSSGKYCYDVSITDEKGEFEGGLTGILNVYSGES